MKSNNSIKSDSGASTNNKRDTSIVNITDSFLLRGIDPLDIVARYLKGEFDDQAIPQTKTQLSEAVTNPDRLIGKTIDDECYQFHDKIGIRRTMITTGHSRYIWTKTSSHNNSSKNKTDKTKPDEITEQAPFSQCSWCKQPIDPAKLQATNGIPIGIPIQMIIVKDPNSGQNIYFFHVDDCFCHPRCGLTQLRRFKSQHRVYRDPNYADSEYLYALMIRLAYNVSITQLTELADWRLLDSNGGPLTKKEYFSTAHDYVSTGNLILLPVKRQYLKVPVKSTQVITI